MSRFKTINFKNWIDDHRHLLKPPVGNKLIFEESEFIVMVVGGPNKRADFHVNESEEFFYQIEGDITLKIRQEGKVEDLAIREGEIFMLPPKVPHSPQRPADTVGLVFERQRRPGELDGFQWFCDNCNALVFQEFFPLTNIVTQLPPLFEKFYGNLENCTCKQCGHVSKRKCDD